jgi:ABC-2 type transport system ATP-binding protein
VSSNAAAVEVYDLTIRYGERVAVDRLGFSADAGTVVALLGPNGAGKTSTVECLEGYRRPTSGSVRVLGLDPVRDHRQLTPQIGVMLQSGGVYTACRPPEVLRLFASYYERPLDPDELLERVGLADRRRSSWRSLSGGEQQRLSLALALVGRPTVAFLDEPTAGVDLSGRHLIHQLIGELRADGVSVVLTTHDLDDAEKLADRVLIIDHGRLVADGSPADLTSGATEDDHVLFAAAPGLDVAALAVDVGAEVTETRAGEYRVAAAGDPQLIAAITAWLAARDLPLADLRVGRKRLEDVFLRLTTETDAPESGDTDPRGPGDGAVR